VPTAAETELESCGNTAFRETEITIDGQPAGVAPVFPWIFTGGIDPFLWFPIHGVQTLNFIPYRVNLTPFAGLLSNGQPHTVSLGVYNADDYFSATASLLLYLDKGSGQTTGEITRNTLTGPSPTVTENLNVQSTSVTGTVNVSSNRSFEISGYVQTSHGKITTTVEQAVNFLSRQSFDITGTQDEQNISQTSSVFSETSTFGGGTSSTTTQYFNFPLTVDLNELVLSNGNINLTTTADQNYTATVVATQGVGSPYASAVVNTGQHKDTLELNSKFNILGNMNQSAAQQYNYFDSTGASYTCDLKAAANVLTSFSKGCLQ
jgi:hypothetical protein